MKQKIIYMAIALVLFTTGACKKDFLNTTPSDYIQDEQLFDNINNVKVALNGIYRMMYMQYSDQEEDGQAAMMISLDFLGEDIVQTATGTSYFRTIHQGSAHRSETTEFVLFTYRMYYRILANVNKLLDGIDNVPNVPTAQLEAVKGELLGLRAFSHFMLVQLFGARYEKSPTNSDSAAPLDTDDPIYALGIPLMTTYSDAPQTRATVQVVYDQINSDLDDAIAFLQNAPARGIYRTHIDKSVAHGLKARVALTQQNWTAAALHANQARQGYQLMSNSAYLDGFSDMKNSEWMWGAHQLPEQLPTYGSFYSYMSANFNSSHTRSNPKKINSKLYDVLPDTDVRKKLFCNDVNDYINFPGVINAATGQPEPSQVRARLMHKKFIVADPGVSAGDIPFMRAAEMYLIEAEALFKDGRDGDALDVLLILVKNRDPEIDPTTIDIGDLANYIDIQRRVELWGEGFRFLDLKRKNEDMDRSDTGSQTALAGSTVKRDAGSTWWRFRIPRREMQANPLMVQNP
jgi:hypothetical protein